MHSQASACSPGNTSSFLWGLEEREEGEARGQTKGLAPLGGSVSEQVEQWEGHSPAGLDAGPAHLRGRQGTCRQSEKVQQRWFRNKQLGNIPSTGLSQ